MPHFTPVQLLKIKDGPRTASVLAAKTKAQID